jgi:hypothetical protein
MPQLSSVPPTIRLSRTPASVSAPGVDITLENYTALLASGVAGITDVALAAKLKALGAPSTGT